MSNIFAKTLFIMLSGLALAGCFGLEEHPDCIQCEKEYPVMLHTMVRPDSKITVTDVKPAWEDGDKLKITAKNDTVAVSELSVYEIDSQNPTKASFTGFVTMKDAPEYCYFIRLRLRQVSTVITGEWCSSITIRPVVMNRSCMQKPVMMNRACLLPCSMREQCLNLMSGLTESLQSRLPETDLKACTRWKSILKLGIDP